MYLLFNRWQSTPEFNEDGKYETIEVLNMSHNSLFSFNAENHAAKDSVSTIGCNEP